LRLRGEQLREQDEPEEYDRECPFHGASLRKLRPVYTRDSQALPCLATTTSIFEKLRAALDVTCALRRSESLRRN